MNYIAGLSAGLGAFSLLFITQIHHSISPGLRIGFYIGSFIAVILSAIFVPSYLEDWHSLILGGGLVYGLYFGSVIGKIIDFFIVRDELKKRGL